MPADQGWTAPAKSTGTTPGSRHGQMPSHGSPSILLFDLEVWITAPGVGKIHHCQTISWGNSGQFTMPVQPRCRPCSTAARTDVQRCLHLWIGASSYGLYYESDPDILSDACRPCPAAAKSAAAQLSGARPAAAREADQAGPSSMHEASDNLTAHSINQSRADGDSADESSLDMLMSGPSSDSQPLYDEFEPSPSGYSESEYYEDPAMDRAAGLEEYEALRRRLQARTLRFGLAVTAYIALTGTTEVSVSPPPPPPKPHHLFLGGGTYSYRGRRPATPRLSPPPSPL